MTRLRLLPVGLIAFALLTPRAARAVPAQMVVFLGSESEIVADKRAPHLSLFSYFYGRTGVSLLGVYAGPRWRFGDVGIEFKGGVYGGSDIETRAIVNNQVDFTKKHLSIAWFTDWYPPDEVYSYLSTMLVFAPLYIGGVTDITYNWGMHPYTQFAEGPAVGLGTKHLYLGGAYLFTNAHTTAVRMTVGLTL